MDAVTMLRADHKRVETLFKQFDKAGSGAAATRRKIADQIVAELSVHAAIEEQDFYPAVRKLVSDQEGLVLESLEEHHIVKWLLSELEGRDPTDERFQPKMTVLIDLVRHHVDEEEGQLFPAVRKSLSRKQLQQLGDAMETAKKSAPKRPHPRSPDAPPANIVVGAVAGVVDRAREATRDLLTK